MHRIFRLENYVPATQLDAFLRCLGEAIRSNCAIVPFPNENEIALLEAQSAYLRLEQPLTPDSATVDAMWASLETLCQKGKRSTDVANSAADRSHGQCRFCNVMRRSPLADMRCVYCNYIKAREAFQQRDCLLYRCHAGLFDMVAPIVQGNTHVADLFVGQNFAPIASERIDELEELFALQSSRSELRDAYQELRSQEQTKRAGEVETRLQGYRPLVMGLANLISLYATTRLASHLFSNMCADARVSSEPAELLAKLVANAQEFVGFEAAGIWARREEQNDRIGCLYANYCVPGGDAAPTEMEPDGGLFARVARERAAIEWTTRADIRSELSMGRGSVAEFHRDRGTLIAAPLWRDGEVTGIIEVSSSAESAFWPYTARIVVEDVSKYIGLFLNYHNDFAELFTNLVRQGAPQLGVRHIPEVLGCLACSVFRLDANGRQLTCDATTGLLVRSGSGERRVSTVAEQSTIGYSLQEPSLTSWAFVNQRSILLKQRKSLDPQLSQAGISAPRVREFVMHPDATVFTDDELDSLSVIVVPIFKDNRTPIGVLRIIGKAGGGEFTEEDLSLAENIASLLYYPQVSVDKVLAVLRMCAAMAVAPDPDTVYLQFLTTITHGSCLEINRAILFDYDPVYSALIPLLAVGPADAVEAAKLGPSLASDTRSLDETAAGGREAALVTRKSQLFNRLGAQISLSADSALLLKFGSSTSTSMNVARGDEVSQELRLLLSNIELGDATYCVVSVRDRGQVLLVCDNIYSSKATQSWQQSLVRLAAGAFSRALASIATERRFVSLRKEWWSQAVSVTTHNLGNKLPFIEDCLVDADRNPRLWEKPEFRTTVLGRLRAAMSNVRDLRRMDMSIVPSTKLRISTLLCKIQDHLQFLGSSNVTVDWAFARDYEDRELLLDLPRILECFDVFVQNVMDLGLKQPKIVLDMDVMALEEVTAPNRAPDGTRAWLRLGVQDNGPGIAPENKKRVLEPYVSMKRGSLGLGLPFVASVLKAHGGVVEEVGKQTDGAKFNLYLPAGEYVRAREQPKRKRVSGVSHGTIPPPPLSSRANEPRKVLPGAFLEDQRLKVLLLDDDEFVAWRLVRAFELLDFNKRKFQAVVARSVDEYVEIQRNTLLDAAVLDTRLLDRERGRERDLDGGIRVSACTTLWNGAAVTVLFSASLSTADCVQAMRNGAWDCIDKNQDGCIVTLMDSVITGLQARVGTAEWLDMTLPELSICYGGKYVAFLDGSPVDSDADVGALRARVSKSKSYLEKISAQPVDKKRPRLLYIHVPTGAK